MALQGDLRSFTLPDVLRLLAGTGKSGSLEVSSPPATGEVWLRDGGVVGGLVSTAPRAVRPADVVLELLRLDGGTFVFDDTDEIEDAPTTSVTDALDEAERLLEEWQEVESIVPSMGAWVSLVPELEGDATVTADSWRMIAAIAGGGSVHDLAEALDLTDLDASRQVKALVESGLTAIRTDIGVAPHEADDDHADLADDESPADHDEAAAELAAAQEADLAVLRSDDRTVVMVDDDDALLPEPLPGEGVAFHGDLIGTVDGRTFESIEQEAATPAPPAAPAAEPDHLGAMADHDVDAAFDIVAAHAADAGEDVPELLAIHDAPLTEAPGVEPAAELAPMAPAPSAEPAPVDDDRDSLLKFLSTVKP